MARIALETRGRGFPCKPKFPSEFFERRKLVHPPSQVTAPYCRTTPVPPSNEKAITHRPGEIAALGNFRVVRHQHDGLTLLFR